MSRKCPTCATEYADDVFFCGEDGSITIEVQNPEDFDPRLGQQLGGYIVAARVADGAMGRVFEGRHPETKARVAIKVLHEHVAKDKVSVERFKREYETAEEMDHPHIIKVLEFGETPDNSWFMTMEFLEGKELSQVLREHEALSVPRALRILLQLCEGLEYAHSFGAIHRDLKPDNIFLVPTEDGDVVRILDFGSVKLQMEMGPKLTAFGTTLGSPFYMSPEQAMGKQDVDHRSDAWAAAAIFYEMLTGKIAYDGAAIAEILMKIVQGKPAPASSLRQGLPGFVDDFFDRAFQKDKEARFEGCKDMADWLVSQLQLPGDASKWARASQQALEAELLKGPARDSIPAASGTAGTVLSDAPPPMHVAKPATPPSAGQQPTSVAVPKTPRVPREAAMSMPDSVNLPSGGSSRAMLYVGLGLVAVIVVAALMLMK